MSRQCRRASQGNRLLNCAQDPWHFIGFRCANLPPSSQAVAHTVGAFSVGTDLSAWPLPDLAIFGPGQFLELQFVAFEPISTVCGDIRFSWMIEGGWTPRFRSVLADRCTSLCEGMHPLDASELRYRLGEVLVELGAIEPQQIHSIDAFLK